MRIHLAGAEVIQYAHVIAATGHKYALGSYFNLQTTSLDTVRERIVAPLNSANVNMIMDSGVFSMMFGSAKDKIYDYPMLDDYADRFIAQVRSYGFKNLTLIEMDVHKILGMDAVFKLREKFEKSGLKTMYVWHTEEGIEGIKELANRYRYIALGCPELRKVFKGRSTSYKTAVWDLLGRIQRATPAIPQVHLLGNTVAETMENHLAYSCDSTSWLSGVRYGSGAIFNGTKIIKAHIRSPAFTAARDRYVSANPEFEKWVQLFKSAKAVEYYKNTFAQAMAFKLYQDKLDRRYSWVGDEKTLKGRI